jgi:hypothetical protein
MSNTDKTSLVPAREEQIKAMTERMIGERQRRRAEEQGSKTHMRPNARCISCAKSQNDSPELIGTFTLDKIGDKAPTSFRLKICQECLILLTVSCEIERIEEKPDSGEGKLDCVGWAMS